MKIAIYSVFSHSPRKKLGQQLSNIRRAHKYPLARTSYIRGKDERRCCRKFGKELEFAKSNEEIAANMCVCFECENGSGCRSQESFPLSFPFFTFGVFLAASKSLHSTWRPPNCSIFHTGNSSEIFKFSNLFNKYSVSSGVFFSLPVLSIHFFIRCRWCCSSVTLWPSVLVY